MTFICPAEFIALAHKLADAARPIAAHYFRNDALVVENKLDHSPVTLADREIEQAMRDILFAERPNDGIWGEEYGRENPDAELTWILDPIDGTKAFTIGRPTFGCLVGLHHKQHGFICGIMDQPVLEWRWSGASGNGAQLNNTTLRTRPVALQDARVGITNPLRFSPQLRQFATDLERDTAFVYSGGECMNFTGIADGSLHAHFDPDQKIYDIAALIPIIREAGGVITHLDGSDIDFSYDHSVLAAGTPELHAELLQRYTKIAG